MFVPFDRLGARADRHRGDRGGPGAVPAPVRAHGWRAQRGVRAGGGEHLRRRAPAGDPASSSPAVTVAMVVTVVTVATAPTARADTRRLTAGHGFVALGIAAAPASRSVPGVEPTFAPRPPGATPPGARRRPRRSRPSRHDFDPADRTATDGSARRRRGTTEADGPARRPRQPVTGSDRRWRDRSSPTDTRSDAGRPTRRRTRSDRARRPGRDVPGAAGREQPHHARPRRAGAVAPARAPRSWPPCRAASAWTSPASTSPT